MAAAVTKAVAKAALTARGPGVAEAVALAVPVAVAAAVRSSMVTTSVAMAVTVASSVVAAGAAVECSLVAVAVEAPTVGPSAAGMRRVRKVLEDLHVLATTAVVRRCRTVVGGGRSMMRGCGWGLWVWWVCVGDG